MTPPSADCARGSRSPHVRPDSSPRLLNHRSSQVQKVSHRRLVIQAAHCRLHCGWRASTSFPSRRAPTGRIETATDNVPYRTTDENRRASVDVVNEMERATNRELTRRLAA